MTENENRPEDQKPQDAKSAIEIIVENFADKSDAAARILDTDMDISQIKWVSREAARNTP